MACWSRIRGIRWSGWLGVVVFAAASSIAFWFDPILRTFTHEFAFFATILTCVVAYVSGIKSGRSLRSVGYTAAPLVLMRALLVAALFGIVMTVLQIAANQFIFGCDWRTGVWFFVATWFPATVFTAVAGTALGLLVPTWKQIAAITGAGLLSLAIHDLLQLYFGPRIHPVDPVLGDLAGFSQRERLAPSAIHLRNRVFLLVAAVFVWDLCRWRLYRREFTMEHMRIRARISAVRVAIIGAALLLAVIGWGGWFGIGFARQPLDSYADHILIADGMRIHYPRDAQVQAKLNLVKREAAWHRHELTRFWEISGEAPVDLYLFPDFDTLHAHTGIAAAHAGLGEIFLDVESATTRALRHEFVHALHPELNPSPFILLSRAMLEGVAVAFEDQYAVVPEAHEVQAAALEAGELPSMVALFTSQGFRATGEFSAYEAVGSFFGFLVLEYGMDKFKAWQQSLNFDEAYGRSLEALDAEWRAFLAALDVRSESRMTAAVYFNPMLNPGYLSAQCPKVGDYPDPLLVAAEDAWHIGNFEVAAGLYRQVYSTHGDPQYLRMAALAREKAERRSAAADLLEAELATGDWRPYEYAALLSEYIVMVAKLRDWNRLYDAYELRAELNFGIAIANRMGERALRDPAVRDDYANVLEAEETWEQAQAWLQLLERHPEYPPFLYLFAVVGRATGAPLMDRAQSLLSFLKRAPEWTNDAAPETLATITELIRASEYGLAEMLASALIDQVTHPPSLAAARQALARIAFEA